MCTFSSKKEENFPVDILFEVADTLEVLWR